MPEIQQPDIVGNYLANYYGAQDRVQKQADRQYQMQRQQVADDQQAQQFQWTKEQHDMAAKADAVSEAIMNIRPGDAAAFDAAKQSLLAKGVITPQEAAQYDINHLQDLQMQSEKWRQVKAFQLQQQQGQAQIEASRASTQHSLAATQALREKPPAGIDPNTGQPVVKLTEGQAKDLSYYRRGVASNNKLDDARSKEMMSGWNSTFVDAPVIGNAWLSPSARQGQQAAKDFIAAILRRDTGAAVSPQEFNYYASFLLPQYGDDATTLAQKKESRAQALESIRAGLGTAEILAKIGPQPTDQTVQSQSEGAAGNTGGAKVMKYDANGNRVQ